MPRKSGKAGMSPIARLPRIGASSTPDMLCTTGQAFDIDVPIRWLEGFDLLRQEPCWVPAEIVHTDYTQPLDGYFLAGSNGLASGNHLVEALSAAICELIERDAVAVWSASGLRARAQRSLDVASIDDPDCRALLAKYDEARHCRSAVECHDAISALPPSSAISVICPADESGRLRHFHGAGCHPDRAIALARALTEAAQTRLTYITGIRDDLLPLEYEEPPDCRNRRRSARRTAPGERASSRFARFRLLPPMIWARICARELESAARQPVSRESSPSI